MEIDNFIKKNAIDFAKRRVSITYLISDAADGALLGYFTLTHKSIIIVDVAGLSNTSKKKLAKYARLERDREIENYAVSAFLLAQFGKNYGLDKARRISGSEMMQIVMSVLLDIQRRIGGGIVYLDCEDTPKLKDFYLSENFKEFSDRFSAEEGQKYIQFLRFL